MAMYSIVAAETLRKGGLDLDEAIVNYVRRKYGVIIGQLTAEMLEDQDRGGRPAGHRKQHRGPGSGPGQWTAASGDADHG